MTDSRTCRTALEWLEQDAKHGAGAAYLFGRELRKRWLDAASLGLFLLVAFAAVYLNHHDVRDVLLGALCAIAAWAIGRPRTRSRDLGTRSGSTDDLQAARPANAEAAPRATAA